MRQAQRAGRTSRAAQEENRRAGGQHLLNSACCAVTNFQHVNNMLQSTCMTGSLRTGSSRANSVNHQIMALVLFICLFWQYRIRLRWRRPGGGSCARRSAGDRIQRNTTLKHNKTQHNIAPHGERSTRPRTPYRTMRAPGSAALFSDVRRLPTSRSVTAPVCPLTHLIRNSSCNTST